jgi:type IV pilus assembly protein PilA
MKKILTKKGFTLIELIVVIAILAILAAILIPSLTNYITQATLARDNANSRAVYSEATLASQTGDTTYTAPTGCTLTPTYAVDAVFTLVECGVGSFAP